MTDEDKRAPVPETLIEDIDYRLQSYDKSASRSNAGHHLIELQNLVSQLKTWHSGYQYESGTLPWEREDWDD